MDDRIADLFDTSAAGSHVTAIPSRLDAQSAGFDLVEGPRSAAEELNGRPQPPRRLEPMASREAEGLTGIRYFSTADWRMDDTDENGRTRRTAALIASIEAAAAEQRRGIWGRLRSIWERDLE